MLIEQSGVSLGEDALSTYYSVPSNTNSSSSTCSSSFPATSSSTSSSCSSERQGSVFGFLGLRSWFGFGSKDRKLEGVEKDIVEEIMECFRNGNLVGMDKFVETESGNSKLEEEDDDEYWWDDDLKRTAELGVIGRSQRDTPHPKKGMISLAPRVKKLVRFRLEMENTPKEKCTRPFTPLITSTPKTLNNESVSSDAELAPLHNCDSNTVAASRSALNNTSSILLTNTSIMGSWCKTRYQTDDALLLALDTERANNYYKLCYDTDDEKEENGTTQKTFVIARKSCSDSESDEKTISFENGGRREENDTSTDSSVVLELDRIEDYIRNLESEIDEVRQFPADDDGERAREALRNARCLQGRICQMSEAISDMCAKFLDHEDAKSDHSEAFEDSRWAAQLDFESGSFDSQEL